MEENNSSPYFAPIDMRPPSGPGMWVDNALQNTRLKGPPDEDTDAQLIAAVERNKGLIASCWKIVAAELPALELAGSE